MDAMGFDEHPSAKRTCRKDWVRISPHQCSQLVEKVNHHLGAYVSIH